MACFGATIHTAFLKAMMSAGMKLPRPSSNILVGVQHSFHHKFLPVAKKLYDLGYQVCTAEFSDQFIEQRIKIKLMP